MDRTSNQYLDDAGQYIVVPDIKDIHGYSSPEEVIDRINRISNPRERFLTFLRTTIKPQEYTHEGNLMRSIILTGFTGGLLFGALFKSPDVHQAYQRKHNASVFDGKYRANRHFYDTLLTGVTSRGLKYGFRVCALTSSAGFIVLGSVICRNKLYLPDYLIGFTTLGALSRLWIGMRGMAVGALLGAIVGLGGYGVARSFELINNTTVSHLRLMNHIQWLSRREGKHRELQKYHESLIKQELDKGFDGK